MLPHRQFQGYNSRLTSLYTKMDNAGSIAFPNNKSAPKLVGPPRSIIEMRSRDDF